MPTEHGCKKELLPRPSFFVLGLGVLPGLQNDPEFLRSRLVLRSRRLIAVDPHCNGYLPLQCKATEGEAPATVSLPTTLCFFTGERILASGSVQLPRFTLLESGSLLISPTRISDAGSYTCLATNSRGVDEASAELVVWGKMLLLLAPCSVGSWQRNSLYGTATV